MNNDTNELEGAVATALTLRGQPSDMGAVHGSGFAADIREFANDRLELAASGTWSGGSPMSPSVVLELADATIAAHEDYAPDLRAEMRSLAWAAGISEAQALVLGGFTDIVDLVRAHAGAAEHEDDCTAVAASGDDGSPLFAQTWDMHQSAARYVRVLRLEGHGQPTATVLTTTGCLGQIGMNDAGIAVGITNLSACAGQIGVTWPFVVRKALQQTRVDDALRCVTDATLAGAHNYILVGADGTGYAVEAMPGRVVVERFDGRPLIRTNHCLDPENGLREAPRDSELVASSLARRQRAQSLLGSGRVSVAGLQAVMRDPPAICRQMSGTHDIATVGAVVASPATGELWIAAGNPATTRYARFQMGMAWQS